MAVDYLAIAESGLVGRVIISSQAAEFRSFRVSAGESALTVDGSLSFDPTLGMDMRLAGEVFNAEDIGPIAGVATSLRNFSKIVQTSWLLPVLGLLPMM